MKADFSTEIADLVQEDLENPRNNFTEESEEMKENKMFNQLMDLERKIGANEHIIYKISQNTDEVWKVHNNFRNKLMSIQGQRKFHKV